LGIRFYRAAESPQGYVAALYSASGTLLGSATLPQESSPLPGWQEADFASPISITANTTSVAAYYCASGQGAADAFGLRYGITNGLLTAPSSWSVGGNGIHNYGNVFPSGHYEASNYITSMWLSSPRRGPRRTWYSALIRPILAFTSSAPLGSVVANIIATWSDGSPFTGTLSLRSPIQTIRGFSRFPGATLSSIHQDPVCPPTRI
jgi:Domain of unknown function (DUF4082)